MKRLSGLHLLVLLLAALGALTYIARKKLPPFEPGVHDVVVNAQVRGGQGGREHAADSPVVAGCPVFPADNVWNTPVAGLPRDSRSDAYINAIGAARPVNADFGPNPYGLPYTLIPERTPGAIVDFEYRDESDLGHYPIPEDAPVERNGEADGDRHVLAIDPRRCMLYELFAAEHVAAGHWKAGSGVKIDLTDNALREEGKTSADAAGLPIFPGLVRYEEVQAGAIHHALRFTIPRTRAAFVWPARHQASKSQDPDLPPMGQRFRLRADYDISGYSRSNQVILQALKTYGMLLADNGSAMYISGTQDKRWDTDDLHKLRQIRADNFEAVDESSLQMMQNSGRVDPVAVQ